MAPASSSSPRSHSSSSHAFFPLPSFSSNPSFWLHRASDVVPPATLQPPVIDLKFPSLVRAWATIVSRVFFACLRHSLPLLHSPSNSHRSLTSTHSPPHPPYFCPTKLLPSLFVDSQTPAINEDQINNLVVRVMLSKAIILGLMEGRKLQLQLEADLSMELPLSEKSDGRP